MNETGKHLRALRKAAGFKSADAIARYIGIAPTRYREYEQGRVALPYEIAWKLADAFNCTMDELGGRQWPKTLDADAVETAKRYAALPMKYREPVKDMIELQETKSRVRVSGNQGVSGIA